MLYSGDWVSLLELKLFGWNSNTILEPLVLIKTYLVRWNGVKTDLTKLAKLRWIENLDIPYLCNAFGKRRTAIHRHLRTLRKCGVSELNLTAEEKKIIQRQIEAEMAQGEWRYR